MTVRIWLLSLLLSSCINGKPKFRELEGQWISSDGATIVLYANGTFTAKKLPSRIFFRTLYSSQRFSGSGIWSLREGQTNWEINLDFKQSTLDRIEGLSSLMLAKNRIQEWYLFNWIEEEGGNKYRFTKIALR